MAQNRAAPAYQEYAASIMAQTPYRVMSLAGRGLMYSLRLECWVNHVVPCNPRTLARLLGYDATEIEALLPEVMHFFELDGDHLRSPELDDYRQHIAEVKEKQSQGGKQTAAKHKEKRKQATGTAGDLEGDLQAACSSLVKPIPAKSNSVNPSTALKVEGIKDEWVTDYERATNGY